KQQTCAALVVAIVIDDRFALVRAGLHGSHAAALIAVEGPVHAKRLDGESARRYFVEDLLCVERPVVIAHASVVASHDEVRTAIVLAESSVEQGFTRPRVAHLHRVTALDHAFLAEI